jgi:hypothetical protein
MVIARFSRWCQRAGAPMRARLVVATHLPWTMAPVSVCGGNHAGQQAAQEEAHMIKRTRIVRIGNSRGICIPKKFSE